MFRCFHPNLSPSGKFKPIADRNRHNNHLATLRAAFFCLATLRTLQTGEQLNMSASSAGASGRRHGSVAGRRPCRSGKLSLIDFPRSRTRTDARFPASGSTSSQVQLSLIGKTGERASQTAVTFFPVFSVVQTSRLRCRAASAFALATWHLALKLTQTHEHRFAS